MIKFVSQLLVIGSLPILLMGNVFANQQAVPASAFWGTWKLVSMVQETTPSEHKTYPFGLRPEGYINYGSDGRMMVILVQSHRKAPKEQTITAEEATTLFRTMNSYAGTYTIEPDCIIHHIDISWNQKWTGTDQIRYYHLDKNKLTLSLPPKRDPQTGETMTTSLLWEKVSKAPS